MNHPGAEISAVRAAAGWRFGDLPFAEEEVRHVSSLFRRSRVLTRAAATEEAVKSAIVRSTHVHFATHGLLDPGEPLLNGLALAQDDDPTEDGLLQVREILRLDLDADLVVLSACNTGLGRLAGGEGVLGLTRAFQFAGARALVLSLWEVGDRSSVDLTDGFYASLFDPESPPDVALQRAQLAQLGRGAAPRDWAAYMVVGDVSEPARTDGGRMSFGIVVAGGILVALGLLFLRWRRRVAIQA
jgi:CHAT domain-containing protein